MSAPDNILTRFHDLLLYIVPQLAKFPRDQKFVLGDRIQARIMEAQEDCLRAYYGREKRIHLLEANLKLEVIRHLVRLAHGLRHFSTKSYEVIARKVDEIGRMIGGWLKQAAERRLPTGPRAAQGRGPGGGFESAMNPP